MVVPNGGATIVAFTIKPYGSETLSVTVDLGQDKEQWIAKAEEAYAVFAPFLQQRAADLHAHASAAAPSAATLITQTLGGVPTPTTPQQQQPAAAIKDAALLHCVQKGLQPDGLVWWHPKQPSASMAGKVIFSKAHAEHAQFVAHAAAGDKFADTVAYVTPGGEVQLTPQAEAYINTPAPAPATAPAYAPHAF